MTKLNEEEKLYLTQLFADSQGPDNSHGDSPATQMLPAGTFFYEKHGDKRWQKDK